MLGAEDQVAIRWRVFPSSTRPPDAAYKIAAVFEAALPLVGTPANQLSSNSALAKVRPGLQAIGFDVETRGAAGSIRVPVLFGEGGRPLKTFSVDAWNPDLGTVIEVEAGIAIDARKIYQDLFEIAAMPQSDSLVSR